MSQDYAFETYTYESLPANCIRVIHIEPNEDNDIISCTFQYIPVAGNYLCCSYEWGSDHTEKEILLEGHSFPVRQNIWNFLVQARKSCSDKALWIDAICIDQSNVAEKNAQVKMMGDVYRHADGVVLWLGILSDEVMKGMRRVNEFVAGNSPSLEGETRNTVKAVSGAWGRLCDEYSWLDRSMTNRIELFAGHSFEEYAPTYESLAFSRIVILHDMPIWYEYLGLSRVLPAICNASYWTRVWIVQEVISAKQILMLDDLGYFEVKQAIALVGQWLDGLWHVKPDSDYKDVIDEKLFRAEGSIWHWTGLPQHFLQASNGDIAAALTLRDALQMTTFRDCLDVRDKVYSIISLLPDASGFVVDYESSNEEVLYEVINYQLQQEDLNLAITGSQVRVLGDIATYTFDALRIAVPPTTDLPIASTLLQPDDFPVYSEERSVQWCISQYRGEPGVNLPLCFCVAAHHTRNDMLIVFQWVVGNPLAPYKHNSEHQRFSNHGEPHLSIRKDSQWRTYSRYMDVPIEISSRDS